MTHLAVWDGTGDGNVPATEWGEHLTVEKHPPPGILRASRGRLGHGPSAAARIARRQPDAAFTADGSVILTGSVPAALWRAAQFSSAVRHAWSR